jgi:hypothetical protein
MTNGMGGLDWQGLPYVAAYLGVQDITGLIDRLLIIKTHKPQQTQEGS